MRYSLILIVASFILFSASTQASSPLEVYKDRHSAMTCAPSEPSMRSGFEPQMYPFSKFNSFGDAQINSDSDPERFSQRYADVTVFPDGKYVVLWEDDRNGDIDIYAQLFTAGGVPDGGNIKLISNEIFTDQRMPVCDAFASGQMAVSWVGSDGNLYLRIYDETLAPVTDAIKVNDNPGENSCNLPQLEWLYGGSIGIVWEDSRNGENAYCQIFTPLIEPLGANFQLNISSSNSRFWSPQIASGLDSGFAVTWEEITTLGSSVVMKTYTTGGIEKSGLISLPDPAHGSDDQFFTGVRNLDGIGYISYWIDTRDGNQSVYSQVVDYSGSKNGANFLLSDNSDYVCWDVAGAASSDGSILITWASYGVRAEIVGTEISAAGDRDGANITISDPAEFFDRFYPRVDMGAGDQPVIVWTDLRSGERDTYIQKLDNLYQRSGADMMLPSVETGAHQSYPAVSMLGGNTAVIVWQDERSDDGDIYMQLLNSNGTAVGANAKVDQDMNHAIQSAPDVASADNGQFIVVWEDARTGDGLLGVNMFARRFYSDGSPVRDELILNDDISPASKSNPSAALAVTGRGIIAWEDERDGNCDIYVQRLSSSDGYDGGNTLVNTDPALSESQTPAVGITDLNNCLVVWRAKVGDRDLIFAQHILPNGSFNRSNTLVGSDSSSNSHGAFDIAIDPQTGDFILAWENIGENDSTSIMAKKYSIEGAPLGDEIVLTSSDDLDYSDISAELDDAGYVAVAWTDSRSGYSEVYMAVANPDGSSSGVLSIPESPSGFRSSHPDIVMTGTDLVAVWMDNRNSESGFDIFANSYTYISTSAEDPGSDIMLPSAYVLEQNYPNPFNPSTNIRFFLPRSTKVSIEIVNLLGEVVDSFDWDWLSSGWHEHRYEASSIATGMYFYRLTTPEFTDTRKMILVK